MQAQFSMPSAVTRCILVFFCLAAVVPVFEAKADRRFPTYPIIAPNVRFWEKIYGTYTKNQGVLHDKNDLSIIYTAINLVLKGTPGAAKINKKLIQFSRHHYRKILEKFADGKKPLTKEERRIFNMFKQKKSAVFLQASKNIRMQTGLKNHFREGVVRSGAYMPAIKRIMRVHGLPLELAYLPHVESSFNIGAHSKAAAVGLWQFTEGTGKEFMTINKLVDERFDFYIASNAAALFLKENYARLGSWPLALTAYNYGRAGMIRARKKWKTYPRIIANHKTKIFGFASKNFYAEFLAALRVARRLENDHSIVRERPWATATLRLKGYASVNKLHRYFIISAKQFERLNPALRQPVLDGKKYIPKGFLLRLPATKRIRRLIRTMPKSLLYPNQLGDRGSSRNSRNKHRRHTGGSRTYRVKKGDTAYSLARRFKISLSTLRRVNKLDSKSTLRSGQKLKIPSSASSVYRRSRRPAKRKVSDENGTIFLRRTVKKKP